MKMITGGCLCRSVRFQIDRPPVAARACWCRDCQYWSCGNYSINLIFETDGVAVEGEMRDYVSAADSGNVMRRRFCPECGTPLFSAAEARPDLVVVRAGALDEPEIARPGSIIWTASAPSWGGVPADLPSCTGQPGPIRRD